MKIRQIDYALAFILVALCGRAPLSQALPIHTDSLDYQGATFTLEAGWTDGRYLMTYQANFDSFQGGPEQSYLKAIDWKWQGDELSSVSLLEAPGGTDQWVAEIFHQIGIGDSVGCELGGDANAVCAEFIGDAKGLSTATAIGDLRWVFELGFKHFRERDMFLGPDLRAAFVNGSGQLAAPIITCTTVGDVSCSSDSSDNTQQIASVPNPSALALLVAGLAGLLLSRKVKRIQVSA